jgi:hypothetical protein
MLWNDSESKNVNGTSSSTLYSSSPVSLSSRFLPESPHDVIHPTREPIEAAIRGVERHINSIFFILRGIQIMALRHNIPSLHITIISRKVFLNILADSVRNFLPHYLLPETLNIRICRPIYKYIYIYIKQYFYGCEMWCYSVREKHV